VISPNGDHLADTARLTFGVNETSRLSLTVLDAKGVAVRAVTAAAATAAGARQLAWDGKVGPAGGLAAAADGAYSVVVRATDTAGNAASARRTVTVDDTLGHPAAAPLWLSPNGDGVRDATAGLGIFSVAAADLDGDGKAEIIAGSQSGDLYVLHHREADSQPPTAVEVE